jgi:hypothetical protein
MAVKPGNGTKEIRPPARNTLFVALGVGDAATFFPLDYQ